MLPGHHVTNMRLSQIQSHLKAMSSSSAAPSPASMRASAASSASTFRSARSCRRECQTFSRELGSLFGPRDMYDMPLQPLHMLLSVRHGSSAEQRMQRYQGLGFAAESCLQRVLELEGYVRGGRPRLLLPPVAVAAVAPSWGGSRTRAAPSERGAAAWTAAAAPPTPLLPCTRVVC